MYDLIGDIIILKDIKNLDLVTCKNVRLIVHKSNYKGVFRKAEYKILKKIKDLDPEIIKVSKKFHIRVSELSTIYKQNNLRFLVDLGTVFMSNRYSNERTNILKYINNKTIGLYLFDGIGCFSLLASKKGKFIYGLDYNKSAIKLARINQKLNKIPNYYNFQMDVKDFESKMLYDVVVTINPYLFSLTCYNTLKIPKIKGIDYVLIEYFRVLEFIEFLKRLYLVDNIYYTIVRPYSKSSAIFRLEYSNPVWNLSLGN
jgi:tRNA G37 N-methylase Trm5